MYSAPNEKKNDCPPSLLASLYKTCQNICSKLSQICLTWSVVVEKIVICLMYFGPTATSNNLRKIISVKMKFHWKQKLRKIFQLCIWSYVSKWTHCNKISCIWLKDLQKILWCTLKKYLGSHEIDFFAIGWNHLHQCKKLDL